MSDKGVDQDLLKTTAHELQEEVNRIYARGFEKGKELLQTELEKAKEEIERLQAAWDSSFKQAMENGQRADKLETICKSLLSATSIGQLKRLKLQMGVRNPEDLKDDA